MTCKSVKVAGGKPAETTVAETCVRLAVIELFKLDAKSLESGFHCFCQVEIVEVVLEGTSHEKFHAKIVDLF